jgi:hypothetical protein
MLLDAVHYDDGRDNTVMYDKLIHALTNYEYHVNYMDCFSSSNNGNPRKRGSLKALQRQLFDLLTCWQKNGGGIDYLIDILESPAYEEIMF